MDQTLLKYWKTCLQDAERKAIAPKGARITLNIGDKLLKFVPLLNINGNSENSITWQDIG